MRTRRRAGSIKRRFPPHSYVIGIDEVGRGALAGPVAVAAVCFPKGLIIRNPRLGILKDSKKLSAIQRQRWSAYFELHPRLHYRVARVYPKGIERFNISKAANLAATRALAGLIEFRELKIESCKIFLDGGLFIKHQKEFPHAETVIKGDEKITAVKIASIIAKVSRDGYMKRLSKKYPQYGFEIHKGYGTKTHFRAIRQYGISPVHRLTFLKKYTTIGFV